MFIVLVDFEFCITHLLWVDKLMLLRYASSSVLENIVWQMQLNKQFILVRLSSISEVLENSSCFGMFFFLQYQRVTQNPFQNRAFCKDSLQLLTVTTFTKCSILDVWKSSDYTPEHCLHEYFDDAKNLLLWM